MSTLAEERVMPMQDARRILEEEFAGVVGQNKAVKRLKELVLGALGVGGHIPLVVLIAPPGIGKSLLLNAFARSVKRVFNRTGYLFNKGDEMGTKLAFVQDVLVPGLDLERNPFGSGFYIDEWHESPKGAESLIRSLHDVTVKKKARAIKVGKHELSMHPNYHNFVLATNKIDQIDEALLSRAEVINLELYDDEELMEILRQGLEQCETPVRVHENTLREIAMCNRGSGRDIVHWVNALARKAGIKNGGQPTKTVTLNKEDIRDIIISRDTYPMGLNNREVATLVELYHARPGGLQLQILAARNQCDAKEQRTYEKYPFQRALLEIEGVRRLTAKGVAYVQDLIEENYITENTFARKL